MLELLLVACIASGSVEETYATLAYGRENTFLLRVTREVLKVAVLLTDDDGPLGGDMALLRVIVENDTVLLPQASQKLERK